MSDEPDERMGEWEQHVVDELFPMVEDTSVFLSLAPTSGKPDVKFCVELGAAIMYDKPILVVAIKGTVVAPGLRRIAHDVVEDVDMNLDADRERVATAMIRMLEKYKQGR